MGMRTIRLLILSVAFAIMGIVFTGMSVKDKIEAGKPRAELTEMRGEDFKKNIFVEGDIYELWDEFAYMEESNSFLGIKYDSRTTAHYYALPLETSFYGDGEPVFVAIRVSNSSDIALAEKMAKESDDFYRYDKEPLGGWSSMSVVGKVTAMTGNVKQYFTEYVDEVGFSSARNACCYVINIGNSGSTSHVGIIFGIILAVLGIGGTLFIMIRKVVFGIG